MAKRESNLEMETSTNLIELNSTFHDVQIKVVEIVNPNISTVTFKDHKHKTNYDHRSSNNLNSFPSHDPTAQPQLTGELIDSRKVEQHETDKEYKQWPVQFTERASPQGKKVIGVVTAPVITVPLDPHNHQESSNVATRSKAREEGTMTKNAILLKQRHREEMLHKKQQIINTFARQGRFSAKRQRPPNESQYYEVSPGVIIADRPVSRLTPNAPAHDDGYYYRSNSQNAYDNRAATVPGVNKSRIWMGQRSAISSLSSKWKIEEPPLPKPNLFVKMPFKQVPIITMDDKFKIQDELLLPGEELRATTAFALSRVRNAFRRMAPPSGEESRHGRLLKGRLRPLRPVAMKGPNITTCRGVQPEFRKQGYSPSPSRQRHLKDQYVEVCKVHKLNSLEDEYERRAKAQSTTPEQSIHRTSPQPEDDPDYQQDVYPVNYQSDLNYSDDENTFTDNSAYNKYARQTNNEQLHYEFDSMRLESNVIY